MQEKYFLCKRLENQLMIQGFFYTCLWWQTCKAFDWVGIVTEGFKCSAAVGLDRVWLPAILIGDLKGHGKMLALLWVWCEEHACPLVTKPIEIGISPQSHRQERLSICQGNCCVNVLCSPSHGDSVRGTCWQQETLLIFALSSSVK